MEFNLSNISIESFKITFSDGKSLTLNPPKLKILRKAAGIKGLGKEEKEEEAISEMIGVVALILSNNKENRKITTDFVEDAFDVADLQAFLKRFFEWVGSIKKNPNF